MEPALASDPHHVSHLRKKEVLYGSVVIETGDKNLPITGLHVGRAFELTGKRPDESQRFLDTHNMILSLQVIRQVYEKSARSSQIYKEMSRAYLDQS
jgi:hypothetical protein